MLGELQFTPAAPLLRNCPEWLISGAFFAIYLKRLTLRKKPLNLYLMMVDLLGRAYAVLRWHGRHFLFSFKSLDFYRKLI